jgi:hypothetical protein
MFNLLVPSEDGHVAWAHSVMSEKPFISRYSPLDETSLILTNAMID